MMTRTPWDTIVIGAGHAGIEAALALSRLQRQVAVITLRRAGIGQMSCNPAIGGVGKGHLVREIGALGGAMASAADATAIQARRLNMSRGPAVRSTRVQSDAARYKGLMAQQLAGAKGVQVIEDEVTDIWVVAGRVQGVVCKQHGAMRAATVIVTTGTFLGGLCHIGDQNFGGGRVGDAPANALSAALGRLGIELRRFKTGTTPRLHRDSIDWEALEPQHGDTPRPTFCAVPPSQALRQVPCYLTYTTPHTHDIVRTNLRHSSLYGGIISGRGPRYCPSLEDKVVRFCDKPRHQIFLEPEGLDTTRVYPNGLSTSLPRDVQQALVRTLPGLSGAHIEQHGYAVEYDFAPPTQLQPSLQHKRIAGLFLAGQINGTSGYEEAAAQGLMAGLNASRLVAGQAPAVLGRDQAYIGVLIDDLVTRGVDEPYRIFTARAEHRLALREGNTEARLTAIAATWSLISPEQQGAAEQRIARRTTLAQKLAQTTLRPALAARLGVPNAVDGRNLADLLRRPDMTLDMLTGACRDVEPELLTALQSDAATAREVEDCIKYAGYISRESRDIAKLRVIEHVNLPADLAYDQVGGLSAEIREKLGTVAPRTLGQASRISGMTPTALTLIRLFLRRRDAA